MFIPGPVTVSQPVLASLTRPLIDHRGPAFAKLIEHITQQLGPLFGTSGAIAMLGSSGTGGMEAALVSLFSPGDRLLSCPVGLFGLRFAEIARAYGCEVEILETELGHALDARRLAERLRADRKRQINGILLTHNETSTGVQNDLAALSRAVADHGAMTLVDSVSGLGANDVRMDEWGFDAVVAASQKVLAAPPGVAMVALSDRAIERLDAAEVPSFYFNLRKALDFYALGQTPWTPPVSTLFALETALDRYAAEGASNVWRRLASYGAAIRAGAAALGLETLSRSDAHSNTVVAIKVPAELEIRAVLRTLREDYGMTLSGGQEHLRGKIFRIGTMGDIAQTDVIALLSALEVVLGESGVAVEKGSAANAGLDVFLRFEEAPLTRGDGRRADARTAARTMATPM
ncbi:MAG: alanine--glyoxylate aminotransferase family protein [Candidatus Eremiobacteraeota bacterium]|nr:alanine--glyoxylate aminotransferase family protein [Candidatus Eremiobacteraeota bacterium]